MAEFSSKNSGLALLRSQACVQWNIVGPESVVSNSERTLLTIFSDLYQSLCFVRVALSPLCLFRLRRDPRYQKTQAKSHNLVFELAYRKLVKNLSKLQRTSSSHG